jgi:FkbM family methyltransferase
MMEKLASVSLPSPHLRLKHCRDGVMLYDIRDENVGRSLDRYGEFATLEVQLFDDAIKPGMLVVEVGSNIGAQTLHLAKLVGERGGVLAFEPDRVKFQMLCANLALNGIENTDAQCLAVGAEAGQARSSSSDDEEGVVDMVSLDNMMLPACHLIKINAKGIEKEVLDGARQTIERFRPAIYATNNKTENHAALIATLLDLEYRVWWHLPYPFNPKNIAGETENIFSELPGFHLFCLPSEEAPAEIPGGVEITNTFEPHPLLG